MNEDNVFNTFTNDYYWSLLEEEDRTPTSSKQVYDIYRSLEKVDLHEEEFIRRNDEILELKMEVDELRNKNKEMKKLKKKFSKQKDELVELREKVEESKEKNRQIKKLKEKVENHKKQSTEIKSLKKKIKDLEEELSKPPQPSQSSSSIDPREENKYELPSRHKPSKSSALSKRRTKKKTKDNRYKSSDISSLYKITTGKDEQFGPETWLTLKLDNPKDMEFLTSLNKRMPDIDKLDLWSIPLNCQEVKTFLATHFPNKVRALNFNSWSSLSSCVPFYLEELGEVSKRVTEQLYIYKFEVSQDKLVVLFSANRHKQWFGLLECKLSLSSVPDFGGTLAGSTIQVLSLSYWGGSSYGDWGNNECHFENLIAGLSKEEDFRKNLKEIGMGKCGMKKNVVEKILADHGFGHVRIAFYSK